MSKCDLSDKCCFYRKFKDRQSVVWKDLLVDFCQGENHRHCERRKHYFATGNCAPDHLTPLGELPEAFLNIL